MKRIIALTIALAASAQANAAGFAPWEAERVESRADAEQAVIETGSFYREGKPARDDGAAVSQADVVITPWYEQGRV